MNMQRITGVAIASLLVLAGCGVETAATAASGAVVKKQEIEQAQGVKQNLEQQLNQVQQQDQQRLDALKQATQ